MYIFQRNFLYYPYKNNYLRGEKLNVDFKEISVPSTEGITLKAWFYKNPQNKYTVLFFHGNAGELGNRIYKLNELKNLNLNYLIISWRGFSGNKGNPTEQGLYSDARSALEWLEKNNISKNKIILYGESLGTVFATAIAFIIQTWAQAHMSSTKVAVILTMEVVFAAIFAVIFGGERLTIQHTIGGVLILTSMYLIVMKDVESRNDN
jgi:multidrug transporter EmrE-like cation transporter